MRNARDAVSLAVKNFWFVGALALSLCGCGSPEPGGASRHSAIAKDAIVIDVRSPEEFAAGHVPGATNIPVDVIESRIQQVASDKTTPLVVHCQSGRRSKRAAEILVGQGYKVQDIGSYANAKSILVAASR